MKRAEVPIDDQKGVPRGINYTEDLVLDLPPVAIQGRRDTYIRWSDTNLADRSSYNQYCMGFPRWMVTDICYDIAAATLTPCGVFSAFI